MPGPITAQRSTYLAAEGPFEVRNGSESCLIVDGSTGATCLVTGGDFAHAVLAGDETLSGLTTVAAPGNTPSSVAVAASARRVFTPLGLREIRVYVTRP